MAPRVLRFVNSKDFTTEDTEGTEKNSPVFPNQFSVFSVSSVLKILFRFREATR